MLKSAALLTALFPALAWATPSFPATVQSAVGAPSAPPCSVCHVNGVTRLGTVNTPMGTALRAAGVVAYNEDSLRTALSRFEAQSVDSDGDGSTDVAELKAGTDPNVASGVSQPSPEPDADSGCSSSGASVGSVLAVFVLGLVRRRAKVS